MIEFRHPAVYVAELTGKVQPIEGVSTSTGMADGLAASEAPHAPAWTDGNRTDPGVTLMELFGFLTESLLYRAGQIPETQPRRTLLVTSPPPREDETTASRRKP